MSWSQSTSRESVETFLLRLLDINADELLKKAIVTELEKRGLTYTELESTQKHHAGESSVEITDRKILFSDGRSFIERLVSQDLWDDEGHDHYGFVEDGPPHYVKREYHDGCDTAVPDWAGV